MNSLSHIRGIIRYDFKKSIPIWTSALTATLLVFTISTIRFWVEIKSAQSATTFPGAPDILAHFFSGSIRFNQNNNHTFSLPVDWLTFQVIVAFAVGFHPSNEIVNRLDFVFSRCGESAFWWISKCVWSLALVLMLYTSIIAASVLIGHLSTSSMEVHNQIAFLGKEVEFNGERNSLFDLAISLAASIAFSYSISLVQIYSSIHLGPTYALLGVVSYEIISIYKGSFPFWGDCGMLLRNAAVIQGGYQSFTVFFLSLAISLALTAWGCFALKHFDAISKEEK